MSFCRGRDCSVAGPGWPGVIAGFVRPGRCGGAGAAAAQRLAIFGPPCLLGLAACLPRAVREPGVSCMMEALHDALGRLPHLNLARSRVAECPDERPPRPPPFRCWQQ